MLNVVNDQGLKRPQTASQLACATAHVARLRTHSMEVGRSYVYRHLCVVHQGINFHFALYAFKLPNTEHGSNCEFIAWHSGS